MNYFKVAISVYDQPPSVNIEGIKSDFDETSIKAYTPGDLHIHIYLFMKTPLTKKIVANVFNNFK